MSRAPKHRVGTVVSREWAARIEAERRALITSEQREQQQQAAEQHKRHEAAGVTCADCDTACQFNGRDITACGDRFTPKTVIDQGISRKGGAMQATSMFTHGYETTVAEFSVAKNTAHRLADQFDRAMFVSPGIAMGYVVSTHEYVNTWYTAHPSSITDQWEE